MQSRARFVLEQQSHTDLEKLFPLGITSYHFVIQHLPPARARSKWEIGAQESSDIDNQDFWRESGVGVGVIHMETGTSH